MFLLSWLKKIKVCQSLLMNSCFLHTISSKVQCKEVIAVLHQSWQMMVQRKWQYYWLKVSCVIWICIEMRQCLQPPEGEAVIKCLWFTHFVSEPWNVKAWDNVLMKRQQHLLGEIFHCISGRISYCINSESRSSVSKPVQGCAKAKQF